MRKYLIIIVIYKREIEAIEPLKYFNGNSEDGIDYTFFIYDNSPYPHEIKNNLVNIVYHHDPFNGGLSKAYNIGAEYAKSNNFEWLILFDQDTEIVQKDFLKVIDDMISSHPYINLFVPVVDYKNGVMSPRKCKYFRPTKIDLKPGIHQLQNVSIINSGLIISTKSFIACGGYSESTFLDFSDYQFIERLQLIEKYFYVVDCHLFQDFSNDEVVCDKLFDRFRLYCESLKNYDTSLWRRLILYYTGLLHSLALYKRTKKIKFVTYYLTIILK